MPSGWRDVFEDRRFMLGTASRAAIWFSIAVLLLGRYYRNWGLAAIAIGVGILGLLCRAERRKHELELEHRRLTSPSGAHPAM
jgi:hypothetical protein